MQGHEILCTASLNNSLGGVFQRFCGFPIFPHILDLGKFIKFKKQFFTFQVFSINVGLWNLVYRSFEQFFRWCLSAFFKNQNFYYISDIGKLVLLLKFIPPQCYQCSLLVFTFEAFAIPIRWWNLVCSFLFYNFVGAVFLSF